MRPRQSSTPRQSRISRQSTSNHPVPTLEHDGIAIALQEALGARVLLVRIIGEGGMGRVYLGRDPQLKRFVAVKVLVQAGADLEAHARFQREAQAIAAISHPNVVAIYGVGELPDGTPYFVMQHVSGGSMAERLAAKGPLAIEMAEGVIGDVAAALAAAHKRGIIHRDVKPANVLWDEESDRATVSDFGIASLMSDDEADIRITQGGMTLGSPAYMSPEQLLAEPITPKSDIYGLGLLGYELLTGKGPYPAESPHAIAAAHLRDEPRHLSELRSDVPPVLEALLERCLAKDAAERPTAEEVMAALTPGAADVLEWPPPGLERARAGLWRLITMPTVGTVFLLLPLLLMMRVGRTGIVEGSIVWPLLLGVSALLGFAAFVRAGYRAWRTGRVLRDAARLHYGWGTLAEVLSDRRGDTGALIAGTHEYAGLAPAERSWYRTLRVARATLLFLAAPMALVAALLALGTVGSMRSGIETFLWVVGLSLLVPTIAGLLAAAPEYFRLALIRKRRAAHAPSRKSDKELAPAWYSAFERSRDGQGFGAGGAVGRILSISFATLATLVVVFCAGVVFSICLMIFTNQAINSVLGPESSNLLLFTAQRNSGGRSYRSPPDGKTTPVEAGEALLNVAATVRRRAPSPIERPVTRNYPRWNRIVPPTGMFPQSADEAWTNAAIRTAPSGFTREQRQVLEQSASHPAREELTRAARAEHADVYGALLRLPLEKPLHPADYPVESLYGIEEAMESYAARVALDVADGRPADAERGARELIAVASLMIDMPFAMNVLRGYRNLQRAVRTLESVYIATGRERDARVLMDSVVVGAARQNRMPSSSTVPMIRARIRDKSLPRGVRMEMALPLLAASCGDARQLLFGIDDDAKRDIAFVRDSLVRFPSERAWIESMSSMASGVVESPQLRENLGALALLPSMVDAIVGGHRFANCMTNSPLLGVRF